MKIMNTLVAFILITGISSPTLGFIESEKGLLQRIIEVGIPKSGNFSTSASAEAEAVYKLLKESCEKNNGLAAYNTAKKSWQDFVSCSKKVELEEIKVTKAISEESPIIFLKKYCVMTSSEKNCVNQLNKSIRPCLKPEERESAKNLHNITIMSVQFMCDDDGARIDKFLADGGQKCVDLKREPLRDCTKEFSSHYNSANRKLSPFTGFPDAEHCTNMEKFQHCYVKLLKECEHHTPADIVDALFNSLRQEMNCGLNNSTSQASVSTVFHIALMTTVMAILLRLG